MKKAFSFCVLVGLGLACAGPGGTSPEANDTTNQLILELNEAESQLKETPFQELLALGEEVNEYREWFVAEYKDTSNKDFWVYKLGDLQRVHKGIKRAGTEPHELEEAIAFSRDQLENLSTAYSSGELDSLSFYTYLMDEKRATEAVIKRANYRSNETMICLKKWVEVKPALDSTRAFHISSE